MARQPREPALPAELLDAQVTFSLREICDRCGTHAEYVLELVDYGILEPSRGMGPREWLFDCASLARLNKAIRLRRDLSLELPGLAIALDLLDEVEQLRRQVAELSQQLRRFQLD